MGGGDAGRCPGRPEILSLFLSSNVKNREEGPPRTRRTGPMHHVAPTRLCCPHGGLQVPAVYAVINSKLSHKCLSLGENGVTATVPPRPSPSWPGHSESRAFPSTQKARGQRHRGRESEARARSWRGGAAVGGGEHEQPAGAFACRFARSRPPGSLHLWLQHVGLLPWPGILAAAASRAACPVPSLEEGGPTGLPLPETGDHGAVVVTI